MQFTKAVVDASVAVKWFSPEIHALEAERFLEAAHKGLLTLYAPSLLLYELGNALGKGKRFSGENIVIALGVLFNSPIEFVPPTTVLMQAAVRMMTTYHLTFYDATYGALAYSLGVPLITADPKDQGKIKEIRVVNLADVKK